MNDNDNAFSFSLIINSRHHFPTELHNSSPGDSVEKLLSHSLEVLGVGQIDMDGVKMLSGLRPFSFQNNIEYAFAGFPPKPLDISDRDRSIDSLGVRNGDTIIFQNLKPSSTSSEPSNPSNSNSSTSSSSSSCPPAPSLSKVEGPSEPKRQKTEIGAKMERQVILSGKMKTPD